MKASLTLSLFATQLLNQHWLSLSRPSRRPLPPLAVSSRAAASKHHPWPSPAAFQQRAHRCTRPETFHLVALSSPCWDSQTLIQCC